MGIGARDGVFKLRCHSPVSGVRLPVRRHLVPRWTDTDLASNVTVHPASQSCPMDRRDAVWSAGTM
jgi:hypothetical protein